MKKILLLLAITATSCAVHHTGIEITSKVSDFHVDKLRRSKSFVVLSSGDTIKLLDKNHDLKIGEERTFTYYQGFEKCLIKIK